MGTGGCLGPKKNKDEIYTKLIREMHDESYKISTNENLDMYQSIKQKIAKKGYLKKFLDNLSTRRHKILESLNLNYKLTSQGKQIQRYYVGLIITDAVMDIVYTAESRSSQKAQEMKRQEDSDDSSNMNQSVSKTAHNSRKHIIKFQPDRRLDLNQQNQTAYDQQYFRLILYLFEHVKKMHLRLLLSLVSFCNKHSGYIQCEHLAWKVIQKLGTNITKNIYLSESCLVFNLLLQMTRDEASEQLRNHDSLVSIIKIWLFHKQSVDCETEEIERNCLQIISIHFQRCICSWYSQFLYEVIFTIYDSIEFSKTEHALLEKMYEDILIHLDMHNNFLRGLFNYLLCYMSVTHEGYMTEADKKLFTVSLNMSQQKIRSQYRNILKDHVKVQCFRLVNSWITKRYILIDQFCLYSNKALIYVYLSNSKYYRNTSMQSHIVDEYFKILASLNLSNRVLFIQRLVEELNDSGYKAVEYQVLIKLLRETVYRNLLKDYEGEKLINMQTSEKKKSFKNPQSTLKDYQNEDRLFGLYLVNVSTNYSHESNLQILKLVGYLIENKKQFELNQGERTKMCQLMYSIYCFILLQADVLSTKYEFTCAVLSLCRILAYRVDSETELKPTHASLILNLFLQKLIQDTLTQESNKNLSLITQYMLVYMIEQLKCLTGRGTKYVDQIAKINGKMVLEPKVATKNNDKEIQELIAEFVNAYFQAGIRGQNQLKGRFSGQLYDEYKVIYGRLFSAEKGRDSNIFNKFELSRKMSRDSQSFSFSVYSMHSRNSTMCQKCREVWEKNGDAIKKPCTHLAMKKNWRSSDTSFQDIMDIVHI